MPQFWLNFGKKNTAGLSISLIVLWLLGDLYKMSYYQQTNAPTQLLMCAVFQVCTDISILSQFWVYRQNTARMHQEAVKERKQHESKSSPPDYDSGDALNEECPTGEDIELEV